MDNMSRCAVSRKPDGNWKILVTVAVVTTLMVLTPVKADTSKRVNYYLSMANNDVSTIDLNQNIDKLDPTVMTHFILHGYGASANKSSYVEMAAAIQKLGPSNVIRVDYHYIGNFNYIRTYVDVPEIGKIFSKLIIGLVQQHNFKLNLIHIIGHSIGAQVAGAAGREVYAATNEKVGWITGLDPTRLGYEFLPIPGVTRLSITDAAFLGMVHTDGGGYGYKEATGHIDFFPNNDGQRMQPGCTPTKPKNFRALLISLLAKKPDDDACSHQRSNTLYTESVLIKQMATKCDSYENFKKGLCDNNVKIVFGITATHNISGKFYFNTRDTKPYLIST